MEAALSSDQLRVRQVLPGNRNRTLANHRSEVDLSSPEAVRQWHESTVGPEGGAIGAVINFLNLAEPFARPGTGENAAPLLLAQWILNVVKELQSDLRQSGQRGGGWLLNFTALDGKFGLCGDGPLPVAQAATIGMFKSIAKEWPEVRVKNIDLDRRVDPQLLFSQIAEEIALDQDLLEVGFHGGARWTLQMVHAPAPAEPLGPLPLDANSVVLITGGAYGITAEAAKQLAREARPRLVLLGRSPLPGPEPPELQGLDGPASLRKHLIATMRRENPSVLPATIERALLRVLKDRQIRANLAALQQAGSPVEYHAMDVRDGPRLAALIDRIYQDYGRLDGVIHAAGVIEDSLIGRKTPESFAHVFSTKVDPAIVLAHKLRAESLKFLAFFSSVAGRFGNAGQIDYAAANEYLNKLAAHLDAQWPGRVVAINWGPWDAGMISDELRRLYAARGISLIPLAEGARMFVDELKRRKDSQPEVLISCSLRAIAAGRPDETI
jgi:NAD(P)-dependent dehydrogenase (short-subunit alcohol dehydrogenase family)